MSTSALPAPRKRRRIFLWVFLAVQALFVLWLVTGLSAASGPETDCGSLSQQACNEAAAVGTGIGVALVIALWVAVDVILGLCYIVYKFATRR